MPAARTTDVPGSPHTTDHASAATTDHAAAPYAPGPAEPVPADVIRSGPLDFLEALAAEYGYVTRHRADPWDVLMASTPTAARRVLRENRRNYVKRDTPDEAMLTPLLGKGLLTTDGDDWKRQRRLVQPAFRPHRVASFDTLMVNAAVEVADRWLGAPAGTPVQVDRDLTSLALAVVARSILGSDIATMGPKFGEAVDAANRFMSHYEAGGDDPVIRRDRAAFVGARRFLDMIVKLLVDGRRYGGEHAGGPPQDVLDELLAADVTDTEIRDQVVTILMAGHETTAKSLTWTLWLLDQNPLAREAVEAEVDRVLGGRLPTSRDAVELAWCRAAVAEAMRMYPPVWLLSRLALEGDVIDGYRVDPGTLVCISPALLHRRGDLWDAPDEFRPERFLPGAEAHDPFAYLPFSHGPRQCVGKEFALLETQLVLAVLCSRLRARVAPGHSVEREALVTLRPKHGMSMVVEARP